jgi:hypothetical protein
MRTSFRTTNVFVHIVLLLDRIWLKASHTYRLVRRVSIRAIETGAITSTISVLIVILYNQPKYRFGESIPGIKSFHGLLSLSSVSWPCVLPWESICSDYAV